MDYTTFYNRKNEKKSPMEIRDEMLLPLLDKDILKVIRETNTQLNDGTFNFVFELNQNMVDNDPSKIKRLKI